MENSNQTTLSKHVKNVSQQQLPLPGAFGHGTFGRPVDQRLVAVAQGCRQVQGRLLGSSAENGAKGLETCCCGSKIGTPKWNPGKWKHGPKPAVPWWLNFDPYPCDGLSLLEDTLLSVFLFNGTKRNNHGRVPHFLDGLHYPQS